MSNYAAAEGSALVRVEVMAAKFATSHTANGVDEIGAEEILESVLIRIVGVGTAIELVRRRVFPTLFVTCIL